MIDKSGKLQFFIGSYTEMLTEDFGGSGDGIYTVEMDLTTGQLEVLSVFYLRNPAYLVSKGQMLYAVSEVENPNEAKVTAFKKGDRNKLEFINHQNIKGSLPCHINSVHHNLFIACYGCGSVLCFPLGENDEILRNDFTFRHTGSSINSLRQTSPHAHQIAFHPNGRHLFVPDLGIDTIKVYSFESDMLKPMPMLDIKLPKGNGPRHMVLNAKGDLGYVMNELTGAVSILKKKKDKFELLSMVQALPETYKDIPSGAAIRLHPKGEFLYAANRTIDIITVFKVKDDTLDVLDYQYTNGKTIREFNITPDGNWLIGCLQDSNEVISYKILSSGLLKEHNRTSEVISPVCVCFN